MSTYDEPKAVSIYDNPTPTLNWLSMPESVHFIEYCKERLTLYQSRLAREIDPVKIYQLQGRIAELKDVLGLKDELRVHLQSKRRG